MRTKRFISLLLAALTLLALTACGAEKDKEKDDGAMTIQPAQLSEEETALTELLGLEMRSYSIFDFQVSGVKSIKLSAYELVGSEWSPVGIGLMSSASDGAGRVALMLGKMNEGATIRYQCESGGGGTKFVMPGGEETGLFYATSTLTASTPVELEQEIPLAIQIATSQSEILSYDVQYFGMPREYTKHGYEHVYAITVTFSASSVSDNSQDAPPVIPASAEPSAS